jgi:hypothetical protein
MSYEILAEDEDYAGWVDGVNARYRRPHKGGFFCGHVFIPLY